MVAMVSPCFPQEVRPNEMATARVDKRKNLRIGPVFCTFVSGIPSNIRRNPL
jgi:hypothetical protein